MNKPNIDLCANYLLNIFGPATAMGLPAMADGDTRPLIQYRAQLEGPVATQALQAIRLVESKNGQLADLIAPRGYKKERLYARR